MKHESNTPARTGLLKPEDILFTGEVPAFALTLYENERPPQGLAGIFDWHCFGKISHALKTGILTGKTGECTYFPYTRRDKTFHLLLLGGGQASRPGDRQIFPAKALSVLSKNLVGLKLSKVGISKADFGGVAESDLTHHFKGVSLWITP